MGKPYRTELGDIPRTYRWATAEPVHGLTRALTEIGGYPLVAIGSGGSLSAAELAAQLHTRFTGQVAHAITPLEAYGYAKRSGNVAFLLVSAGGKNSDIVDALRHVVSLEPCRILVLTAECGTKLGRLGRSSELVDVSEFDVPQKDGFLATGSLAAFSVLLGRAYGRAFGLDVKMPSALSRCTPFHQFNPRWEMTIERICEPLWKRETLTVLHSRDLRPMARDLESRFTEAAIGHIQFSDIRNFGHGRHNWLAKHGDTTGVLALASTADQAIARRTLDLLPVDIPQAMIDFPDGPGEPAVGGVLLSIYLAGVAGEARDIDPGRPGVPSFGRKIYHLRNGTKRPAQEADAAAAAIDRKISSGEKMICCKKQRRFWRDAHRDFCDALTDKKFNGIVFDYDGTLCARRERIDGPSDQVSAALTRLASRSIPIGIATGRGRSVRKALRRRIPREFWPLVTVGYYNGGMIGQLSQNSCPQRSSCSLELSDVEKAINRDSRLRSLAESIETRGGQISVQCASNVSASVLRSITQEIVERCGPPELRVVWSTHSVDILASNVTKVDVVRAICERHELADQAPILKIGDLGQWPGNDYQLLAEADSLSVDQISPARNTCWNLAPPGTSGTDALLSYLGAISPREGGFYFFPERIRRKRRR